MLLSAPLAHAKRCTRKEANAADAALVGRLDSWAKVKEFFTKYRHCDEGYIAEGSSEAIARLLADHWDLLPQLAPMIEHNKSLRTFVMSHINATLNDKDIDKIKAAASSSCPSGMDTFCQELTKAATKSIAEMKKSPE